MTPAEWAAKRTKTSNDSSANLGFEAKLWTAADALRNNMDPAELKHVALGLLFLKYISDAYEAKDVRTWNGEHVRVARVRPVIERVDGRRGVGLAVKF